MFLGVLALHLPHCFHCCVCSLLPILCRGSGSWGPAPQRHRAQTPGVPGEVVMLSRPTCSTSQPGMGQHSQGTWSLWPSHVVCEGHHCPEHPSACPPLPSFGARGLVGADWEPHNPRAGVVWSSRQRRGRRRCFPE